MVHENRGSKEDSGSKEPKKCKSHLFKEAYDLVRKKKITSRKDANSAPHTSPLAYCPAHRTEESGR